MVRPSSGGPSETFISISSINLDQSVSLKYAPDSKPPSAQIEHVVGNGGGSRIDQFGGGPVVIQTLMRVGLVAVAVLLTVLANTRFNTHRPMPLIMHCGALDAGA
jgi:hypothetical protein